MAASAVAATAFLTTAPGASAADPHRVGQGIDITGVIGFGTTWLGAVGAPNGAEALVWCIQAGLISPAGLDIASTSLVDDPLLARILEEKQGEDTVEMRAVLGYLVHARHDIGSNGATGEERRAAIVAAAPQWVKDGAQALLDQYASQAGPYAGQSGQPDYTEAQRKGRITDIGLQSASGVWQAGKPVTVTLNGPAVFDATGTNTWTGVTEANPLTLAWTATGNGEVTYRVTFNGVGRKTLTRLDANGSVQAVLTTGNRSASDPEEITTPGTPFDVVLDFRFRGTTTVQADVVDKGSPLVDLLTASAADGDTWAPGDGGDEYVDIVAQVTWYGPYSTPQPEQATVPAGAPVAGVETVTFPGPGQIASPGSVTAPADGFYTAVLSVAKADQGKNADRLREDWTAPFFEEAETSVVKAKVSHWSMAREYNVAPGGQAFDTIMIDELPADHTTFAGLGKWAADTTTATIRVYGPFESAPQAPEVPADAPVLYETTVKAVNGTFITGYDPDDPITLPQTTTYPTGDHYVFVYHLAGDSRVEEYTSPFNDVRERFYVPGPQVPVEEPTVVTQAQPSAKVGEEFDDVALVTGSVPEGAYLVFEAYGPRDPAAQPSCDVDPVWTSKHVPVTGQGYYSSGKTTVDTAGAVDWVETLYGPDGEVLHRGQCGAPGETTIVSAPETPATENPWVTTKATSDNGTAPVVGDKVWDTVEIGGTFPAGSRIVVDLHYAAPGQELVCTEPIWTSTEIPIVDGVTEYETTKYVTGKPGTYGFVERVIGPDGQPVTPRGVCGLAAETLVVSSPPVAAASGPTLAQTGATVAGFVAASIALAGLGAWLLLSRRARTNAGD